ncbi:hypothetical protein T4C_13578 [Trichinella pseudospiralis]|uniref:Uncharacterized protein n=1 Tax=Trichinella pseudospiralis TaxID=6337 RepID=A0A0V1IT62_TRIPS|nr:hypothetical protein T4C_13578 [Trichinella pseudospiralis]
MLRNLCRLVQFLPENSRLLPTVPRSALDVQHQTFPFLNRLSRCPQTPNTFLVPLPPKTPHKSFPPKRSIKSRKNLCLLSVLNSYHSRTCLPENVCKFLFHRYVYSYLALVSIVAGVRYAL